MILLQFEEPFFSLKVYPILYLIPCGRTAAEVPLEFTQMLFSRGLKTLLSVFLILFLVLLFSPKTLLSVVLIISLVLLFSRGPKTLLSVLLIVSRVLYVCL